MSLVSLSMNAWIPQARRNKNYVYQISCPAQVKQTELAGEKILTMLTQAPGNDAPIGGLKVIAKSGWFAARPSGTENIYKIYAESFQSADHLHRIHEEAQIIVSKAIAPAANSTTDPNDK